MDNKKKLKWLLIPGAALIVAAVILAVFLLNRGPKVDKDSLFVYAGGSVPAYLDGDRVSAGFSGPMGICVGPEKLLYVADSENALIRSINTENGIVGTWAGAIDASDGYYETLESYLDEAADSAYLGEPAYLCSYGDDVFFTDAANHSVRVVRNGRVLTYLLCDHIEGYPEEPAYTIEGTGFVSWLKAPRGITADREGNLYVCDAGSHCIVKIDKNGVGSVYAGMPGVSGSDDGTCAEARFFEPTDIYYYNESLYVTDSANNLIRIIQQDRVSTVAGAVEAPDENGRPAGGDVVGPAGTGRFNYPTGLCVAESVILVCDTNNNAVKAVLPDGSTILLFGSDGGLNVGKGGDARLNLPRDVVVLGDTLYVTENGGNMIRAARFDFNALLARNADKSERKITARSLVVFSVLSRDGGKVRVIRGAEELEAFEGMRLTTGDRIRTDGNSMVYLKADSDKTFRLSTYSTVSISESGAKKLLISLETGEFFFNVENKLADDEEVMFSAGGTTMSIRGTAGECRYMPEAFAAKWTGTDQKDLCNAIVKRGNWMANGEFDGYFFNGTNRGAGGASSGWYFSEQTGKWYFIDPAMPGVRQVLFVSMIDGSIVSNNGVTLKGGEIGVIAGNLGLRKLGGMDPDALSDATRNDIAGTPSLKERAKAKLTGGAVENMKTSSDPVADDRERTAAQDRVTDRGENRKPEMHSDLDPLIDEKKHCDEHPLMNADPAHSVPMECGAHFACSSAVSHAPAACGTAGHFDCDGRNHVFVCPGCGMKACADGFVAAEHAPGACGTAGHYLCDKKDHSAAACGVHFRCEAGFDEKAHAAASCGLGHYICDGKNHTPAPCGVAGHYNCDGGVHDGVFECGVHKGCDGRDHKAAVCGMPGHFSCDGRDHHIADCGQHPVCAEGFDPAKHVACPSCGVYSCSEDYAKKNHTKSGCGHWTCTDDYALFKHVKCAGCGLYDCNEKYGTLTHEKSDCGHWECAANYASLTHVKCPACGVYACAGAAYTSRGTHTVCMHCGKYDCTGGAHNAAPCGKHFTCEKGFKAADHAVAVCGVAGHYVCDGKTHSVKCPGCGAYACDPGYNAAAHTAAACGTKGHYLCDGKTHVKDACGHLKCADGYKPADHAAAACGVSGHYLCDGKDHSVKCPGCGAHSCDPGYKPAAHAAAACGTAGHYVCDGKDHTKAACGELKCSDGFASRSHAAAACGAAGHYVCDGKTHTVAPCGHAACADGYTAASHTAASCGTAGHYVCDGRDHTRASCGHLACAEGFVASAHGVAPCGVPGHLICAPDGMNHVLCPGCGKPGCLGTEHVLCDTCGKYRCNGEDHGTCPQCGNAMCNGGSHVPADCGQHYECAPGIDPSEHTQAVCGTAGHYNCDGLEHLPMECGFHYSCTARPGDTSHTRVLPCGCPACRPGHELFECGTHCNFNAPDSSADEHEQCPFCDGYDCADGHFTFSCGRHCSGIAPADAPEDHIRCSYCGQMLCNGASHAVSVCGHRDCVVVSDPSAHTSCPGCGTYICSAGYRPAAHVTCEGCGVYVCASGYNSYEHGSAPCGTAGHYRCDGADHGMAPCGNHYVCSADYDKAAHVSAACGNEGHYACDGNAHAQAVCGHWTCTEGYDPSVHGAAACGTAGHYACDGYDHGTAVCGTHRRCEAGFEDAAHAPAECGVSGHFVCDENDHFLEECGSHYRCMTVLVYDVNPHTVQNGCGCYQCKEGHELYSCGEHCNIRNASDSPEEHEFCYICEKNYLCARGHIVFSCGEHCTGTNPGEDSSQHAKCAQCGRTLCSGEDHTVMECGHSVCAADPTIAHTACPGCGTYVCSAGFDPNAHSTCSGCGAFICAPGYTDADHAPCRGCGVRACDPGYAKLDHSVCANCGAYCCDGGNHHSTERCGHYSCAVALDPNAHAFCEGCGGYVCDGRDHSLAACGAHYTCAIGPRDEEVHTTVLVCGHYACAEDHVLFECGTHCSLGSDTTAKMHMLMKCGKHYACEETNPDFSYYHMQTLDCGHFYCELDPSDFVDGDLSREAFMKHQYCEACGGCTSDTPYEVCGICGMHLCPGNLRDGAGAPITHTVYACGEHCTFWTDGVDDADGHSMLSCGHPACAFDHVLYGCGIHCSFNAEDDGTHYLLKCGHPACEADKTAAECDICRKYLDAPPPSDAY